MKRRLLLTGIAIMIALTMLLSVSCYSQNTPPAYYNAGASDFAPTGTQFFNTILFRFDTSVAGHTLTTPSAVDIISAMNTPSPGAVLLFAIAADGANPVSIIGGPGVTVKTAASSVAGNSTLTIYCELDNTGSGTQQITIY